jgi:hypothetical protein
MRRLLHCLLLCWLCQVPAWGADSIAFWNVQQRGANCFNETPPGADYFKALRGYGATWVRLTFSKWPSASTQGDLAGDFLFGSLDEYRSLVSADLETLRGVLDLAHAAGLRVVLVPLELPGARWRQQNQGQFDDRLWSDEKYWRQAAAFWRDLASALRDHPAIAAYNLINEPVPELRGGLDEYAAPETMRDWYQTARGTTRDLPRFYDLLVREIRAVDARTPIMLDAGIYAAASAWSYWPAAPSDTRLLFAYHMYEPWSATSASNLKRETPYRYPGEAPLGRGTARWNAASVAGYLHQPVDWARRHGVPINRLVAGEFGCMRRWPDCARYLDDVLGALERDGVHWAFYSFRESWDGMDYELGSEKLPWQYWEAVEAGRPYELKRGPNKVFDPILRRLRGRR